MCRAYMTAYSDTTGREWAKQRQRNQPRRLWAIAARNAHKKKGLRLYFTLDDLDQLACQSENCTLCGRSLNWRPFLGHTRDNSPSMDVINPRKWRLFLDDIQIVCHQCKRTKGNRDMPEFLEYCREILRRHRM